MIMPILILFGLISIMAIYFYFDNGNFMPYLVVAYSATVILKLFVEINEVSYLKKIYRVQAQQDDKLGYLIYLLEHKYLSISDSSNIYNSSNTSIDKNQEDYMIPSNNSSNIQDKYLENNQEVLREWINKYVQRESDVVTKLGHHNSLPNTTLFGNYKEFCKNNNFESYNISNFKIYLLDSLNIHNDMKHQLLKLGKSEVITNIRLLLNK